MSETLDHIIEHLEAYVDAGVLSMKDGGRAMAALHHIAREERIDHTDLLTQEVSDRLRRVFRD